MDYHLKTIEQFVSTYLKPNETLIDRLDKAIVEDIILRMILEIEKVKIYISQSYYSYDDEKTCEQFIKNHQRRIVIIINAINKDIMKVNSENLKAKLSVQREVVTYLNELLKYLESEYTQCLDDKLFITTTFGNQKALEFAETTARFHDSFYYSDSLVRIALEPIDTFIRSDKTKYTYAQLNYLARLTKEIDQLQRKVDLGFKVELINMLTYINFNNNSFLNFLSNQIKKDVYKEDTVEGRLLRLSHHLKHHKQRVTNSDLAFLPKRPNIKNQIVSWVKEEIKFLETSRKLSVTDKKLKTPEIRVIKYQFDISKEELSLLIRIAIDSGILKIDDVMEFSRFVCHHFSTKKQRSLSVDSLYNSIYKNKIEDGATIKSRFKNWINSIGNRSVF